MGSDGWFVGEARPIQRGWKWIYSNYNMTYSIKSKDNKEIIQLIKKKLCKNWLKAFKI